MALRYPSICQRLLCRRNLYCIANFRGFLVQILGRKISSQDSAASTMDWCKLYCSLLQTKLQGFLYVHNYTENVNDSSAKLQMFFATQFCKENILSIWRCFTPTMVYGARVNYAAGPASDQIAGFEPQEPSPQHTGAPIYSLHACVSPAKRKVS